MPFISIICPTMRVGGLNILFDSLVKQTWTDFEVVLVDAFHEQRRAIVDREARDRFLCVRHAGLSPNPFPLCAFSTYSNAGIMASTGDVLLFIVDYSRLPPDLLERHATFHKCDPTGRAGLMGPHRYIGLDVNPEFAGYDRSEVDRYEADANSGRLDRFMWSIGDALDEWSLPHSADGDASVPYDADPKLRLPAGRIGPEFFHAKNESVRRERVLEVVGYDQELDGAHLYQDTDFADRLTMKAGVQWLLDPSAIIEIANPRHVFPFARRLRSHEDNKAIWERKRAAGYPQSRRSLVDLKLKENEQVQEDLGVGRVVTETTSKMRVAMIYGEFSSAIHGPFDLPNLYTGVGLTGSESSFFNLMRSLAERGHEVVAFCHAEHEYTHPSGAVVLPIQAISQLPKVKGVDAVIAWNEPDYLAFAPPGAKRYCDQQLNDFGYCRHPSWRDLVDQWVSPSENHKQNVMASERIPLDRCAVIPNSVDLDLFAGPDPERAPHRVVWCSSPDRGLHHLLCMWPEIKKVIPDAELRVFYRLAPWLARARDNNDEVGRRARYIEDVLPRLRPLGVEVFDVVPNARMAQELRSAAVLAYSCSPVRYTEGFGCSVLDAATAGCIPIISDADALPSVHGDAAVVVPGKVEDKRRDWVSAICAAMQPGAHAAYAANKMRAHGQAHDRRRIAVAWEKLIAN